MSIGDEVPYDNSVTQNKDQHVVDLVFPECNEPNKDEGLEAHAQECEQSSPKQVCQEGKYNACDQLPEKLIGAE
jgi:hypothetical protein